MAEIEAGTVLGDRFEVIGVLGRGGMATVYLAQDRVRDDRVALKVLHEHLAHEPAMRDRLRREVQAAAHLRHSSALVAHDLHEMEGVLGLSLPYHPGRTLTECVAEQGPLEPAAIRRLGARLGEVLAEAHRAGLVHRDVTPNNVMLGERGEPVLTDFGLARLRGGGSTRGTAMLGTAGYAAPEVYTGTRSDPRSDLYALGAVLYYAATGRAPFGADNPMGVLQKQLSGEHVPLGQARPDLPQDLVATVEALIQLEPAARPQGAQEVVEALKSREAPGAWREALAPPAAADDTPSSSEPVPESGPRLRESLQPPARPHLPEGPWEVVVRERSQDRNRRDTLRATRRVGHPRSGDEFRRLFVHLKGELFKLLGVPEGTTPERYLAIAVAREAGLPDEALRDPEEVLEKRFRLVEGVDRSSADRLAAAAGQVGFHARSEPMRSGRHRGSQSVFPALVMGIAMVALGMTHLAGVASVVVSIMGYALLAQVLLTAVRGGRRGRPYPQEVLPCAFPRDLRPLLAPGYEHLLGPPQSAESTPDGDPKERSGEDRERARTAEEAASPEPDREPEPPATRGGRLVRRVNARLDALERVLEREQEQIPAAALRDLGQTLERLRGDARALGQDIDTFEGELDQLVAESPPTEMEERLAQAQARLARLHTLDRAGEPVDGGERRRLEAELRELAETQATVELLESRITARQTRLLDIGATAIRVRRQLLDEPDVPSSAGGLAGQLRNEAEAVARARRELAHRQKS